MTTKRKPAGGAKTPAPEPKTAILATLPEMVPTQQDGILILDFFNGLVAFSRRAMQLETRAKETLLAARALQPPTSADEDAAIQTFIKRATADEKEVEDTWKITKIISGFHKRLTAARGRATTPLEESKNIAQRLHNRYVEERNRAAALETERRRVAEEQRAAAARQKELDDLEALALKAEESAPDLSEREQRFVDRIVRALETDEAITETDLAIFAARSAGFKDARHGLRLIESPKIKAAVQAARDAIAVRRQKDAVAKEPVAVDFEEAKPEVGNAGSDRTTWGAEVFDLEKWRAGVLAGTIPIDTAVPHAPTINEYGRKLHEQIDRWPGVRHTKNTRTV